MRTVSTRALRENTAVRTVLATIAVALLAGVVVALGAVSSWAALGVAITLAAPLLTRAVDPDWDPGVDVEARRYLAAIASQWAVER